MGTEKQQRGELYASHALTDSEPLVSPISIPKIRETRDLVYSGTVNIPKSDTTYSGSVQPIPNRKQKHRKISPFTIVLILLGSAIASVVYISNILAVGQLMIQINQLRTKHHQILNEQELLKAQINRLSGLERIQQLAQNQLGLKKPRQLPQWIEIDPERIHQVEEVLQRMERRR